MKKLSIYLLLLIAIALVGCSPQANTQPASSTLHVLAVESFLGDLTRQVAGERAVVETLIPDGLDPHAFTPAPADVARISDAQLLVVNGAGLEEWLQETLNNAGGERL
ncbi:MAG TPA: zinc ABC transporter substrate-binding protein, partial [Anaerolineaceae bacterium]|nr:zinc ABC transporter substrate-binding protein [Anaerolineaceae bacterium]